MRPRRGVRQSCDGALVGVAWLIASSIGKVETQVAVVGSVLEVTFTIKTG